MNILTEVIRLETPPSYTVILIQNKHYCKVLFIFLNRCTNIFFKFNQFKKITSDNCLFFNLIFNFKTLNYNY